MIKARIQSFLLAALFAASLAPSALAAGAPRCPTGHGHVPSAEARQRLEPIQILRCFMTAEEIDQVFEAIGHDAQTTVTDPQFDSGRLDPDGTPRPPLSAEQIDALIEMHSILDQDMRAGAILRKFIPNSDIGGFLYGRIVIGSPTAPVIVTTDTVRGFVGLERNTLGLSAARTVSALGLDFETVAFGQFTDATANPLQREVALEILENGLHSIRHVMSAQGAIDAKIPLAKDLRDAAIAAVASFANRSTERNRAGQTNPYTGLGISADLLLLTLKPNDGDARYPIHLNEEDVMTVPTPLAVGDELLRRAPNGSGNERVIARYTAVTQEDGTVVNRWVLARHLPPALEAYYQQLFDEARARVEAAGG